MLEENKLKISEIVTCQQYVWEFSILLFFTFEIYLREVSLKLFGYLVSHTYMQPQMLFKTNNLWLVVAFRIS